MRAKIPKLALGMIVLACTVHLPIVRAAPILWRTEDGGNNHWYEAIYVPSGINWHDADTAATAGGRYLATITSGPENAFVYGLASANPSLWYFDAYNNGIGPWLGGLQPPGSPEPGGNWQWVTAEPFGYTNWAPYEPSNFGGGEDRLQFFGYQTLMSPKWNDIGGGAGSVRGYIAEWIPEPATLSLLALGILAVLKRNPKS